MNAVANAWLDGDKVLVTSTNNGAVDVAVARAAKDVSVGLLIRTGNRDERVARAAVQHDPSGPKASKIRLHASRKDREVAP